MQSGPDRLNGTWQTTVTWPERTARLDIDINTPGRIRVLLNDIQVHESTMWQYEARSSIYLMDDSTEESNGLELEPGATVTVTVIAERTSGDWAVRMS